MKPKTILRHLVTRIRSVADAFADNRQGPNLRYTLADAVLSAFACFFLQSPSFLAFQRRMQDAQSRSNCQTLFGMQGIPSDGQIRNLLDRLVPDWTCWIRFVPRGIFRRLYVWGIACLWRLMASSFIPLRRSIVSNAPRVARARTSVPGSSIPCWRRL